MLQNYVRNFTFSYLMNMDILNSNKLTYFLYINATRFAFSKKLADRFPLNSQQIKITPSNQKLIRKSDIV